MINNYIKLLTALIMVHKLGFPTQNTSVQKDLNISIESNITKISLVVCDSGSNISCSPLTESLISEDSEQMRISPILSEEESMEDLYSLFYQFATIVDTFGNRTPPENIENIKKILERLPVIFQTMFDFKMLEHGILTEFNGNLSSERIDGAISYAFSNQYPEKDLISCLVNASFPHSENSLKIARRACFYLSKCIKFSDHDKLATMLDFINNPYNLAGERRILMEDYIMTLLSSSQSISDSDRCAAYKILASQNSYPDQEKRKYCNELSILLSTEISCFKSNTNLRIQNNSHDFERQSNRSPIDSLMQYSKQLTEHELSAKISQVTEEISPFVIREIQEYNSRKQQQNFAFSAVYKKKINQEILRSVTSFFRSEFDEFEQNYFDQYNEEIPSDNYIKRILIRRIVSFFK